VYSYQLLVVDLSFAQSQFLRNSSFATGLTATVVKEPGEYFLIPGKLRNFNVQRLLRAHVGQGLEQSNEAFLRRV
ncbi:unnamed protein product, partial [Brassica rapa]